MSDDEIRAAMGARLLLLRAGIPQAVFAERLGVHAKTIQRWEAGAALPDGESLLALWREYGAEPSWVLKGGDSVPLISAEERALLTHFRAASEEVRRAALGALLSGGVPRPAAKLTFHAPVGQVVKGDSHITAGHITMQDAGSYSVPSTKANKKGSKKP